MKNIFIILLGLTTCLFACKKDNTTTTTSTPPLTLTTKCLYFSLTKDIWDVDGYPQPVMHDTILSTSYFQINNGNKVFLPTISCLQDTSSNVGVGYPFYIDTFAVNSGDIFTFCINMKHRWAYDTAWNTYGTWIDVYQYGPPYGLEQHEIGQFDAYPVWLGGKGEGLDQGIDNGDTLSQTVSYKVQ